MLSVLANMGMLGFFKYGGFLLDNFVTLAASVGVQYQPPGWDIILPVGVSFYTFQTTSYTLDVYHRRSTPCDSFTDFALYVTFFPQLVAGPIVRATNLLPQFAEERKPTGPELSWGLGLMSWGMFQKIVLAGYASGERSRYGVRVRCCAALVDDGGFRPLA